MKLSERWKLIPCLLLAGGSGCSEEADLVPVAAAASFQLPACEKYSGEPNIEGYCRMIWAPTLESQAEMEESCGRAGPWEGECRAAWLEVQMTSSWGAQQSHHDLLKICGAFEECALAVLKTRTDPSIQSQLRLCRDHTGDQASTCAMHSLQRWWRGQTDTQPIQTLRSIDTSLDEDIGWWIAAIGTCTETPIAEPCADTSGDLQTHCQTALEGLRSDRSDCSKMEMERAAAPPATGEASGVGPAAVTVPTTGPPSRPQAPPPGPGIGAPDPRTHGHVPDGVPGGGSHPPPDP